jgi:hypothetical protein
VSCGFLLLAGCSGGVISGLQETGATQATAGARLTGVVHGGQNPISGARVYLFAAASGASGAGAAAYGGSGIAASVNNASVSLLTSAGNTTLDQSGTATNGDYYVTTDSNGNFSITGDYSCTAGQQVYLYALGGNPGLGTGTNAAAGLMAALGNCPGGSSAFAAGTPYVVVNEVSTVAAAYAMAGFATDAVHVGSSGTALALTGIANAFANAGNLETLSTGAALATTPAGNGTVPQAEINTLANVLAACVNSNGAVTGPASATPCYTLFHHAESAGGTGTVPSDTATAAINIAHYPAANVAALYGLSTAAPPFGGALTAQPNDFVVAVSFTGAGLSAPFGIAIDGAGNAWSAGGSSVAEQSSLGAVLTGTSGITGSGLGAPRSIAIDLSGDAWIPGTSVVEISSTRSFLSGSSGFSGTNILNQTFISNASGIAIDGSGNVWVPNQAGNEGVWEFSSAGNYVGWINGFSFDVDILEGIAADPAGYVAIPDLMGNFISEFTSAAGAGSGGNIQPGAGLNEPSQIAIDANGSMWVTNDNGNGISKISKTGTPQSGTNGFTGGGLNDPFAIAIDGADNVWVANGGTNCVTELSNSGSPLSGSSGMGCVTGSTNFFSRIALDGSGNVWVTQPVANTVMEMIGAGTPVVTPLAVGVQNNTLGTRP